MRNIKNGVETLARQIAKPIEHNQKAWREVRAKLNSMLMTNVMPIDEIRKKCIELDSMNTEGRYNHIHTFWGKNQADKAFPLLQQLESIETAASKIE